MRRNSHSARQKEQTHGTRAAVSHLAQYAESRACDDRKDKEHTQSEPGFSFARERSSSA